MSIDCPWLGTGEDPNQKHTLALLGQIKIPTVERQNIKVNTYTM